MLPSGPDKDDLRHRETIATVGSSLGVNFDADGRANCPFHADRRPSFTLWIDDDGVERWGCFPCGISGDVFDLVQRAKDVTFNDAVNYVKHAVRNQRPRPVQPRDAIEFNAPAAAAYVLDAQARATRSDGNLCVAAGLATGEDTWYGDRLELDEFLRSVLGWGVDEEFHVVMPHRAGDEVYNALTGVKIRSLGAQKWSFPGSRYVSLYGVWLPRTTRDTLILCEGETDLAYTAYLTRHAAVDVLALPRGAQGPLEGWLAVVQSYDHVIVAFDGDEAGDKAAANWRGLFHDRGVITRFRPPEGEDMRQSKPTLSMLLSTS